MAALDAKTVNAKSVETVKLNCIQKVSSANNKRLWQLNKAYREAEHDLQLMESIGAISKRKWKKPWINEISLCKTWVGNEGWL